MQVNRSASRGPGSEDLPKRYTRSTFVKDIANLVLQIRACSEGEAANCVHTAKAVGDVMVGLWLEKDLFKKWISGPVSSRATSVIKAAESMKAWIGKLSSKLTRFRSSSKGASGPHVVIAKLSRTGTNGKIYKHPVELVFKNGDLFDGMKKVPYKYNWMSGVFVCEVRGQEKVLASASSGSRLKVFMSVVKASKMTVVLAVAGIAFDGITLVESLVPCHEDGLANPECDPITASLAFMSMAAGMVTVVGLFVSLSAFTMGLAVVVLIGTALLMAVVTFGLRKEPGQITSDNHRDEYLQSCESWVGGG